MDYQPPPVFSRGPAPLVRLGFFVCLAVLLMVLDARFRYAESLRQVIALLAYPLQRVALVPGEMFGGAAGFFTTQVSLKQENEQLKAKQLLAANELLTVQALRSENAQLRRLLEARERLPRESTLAEILYQGRDPFSRKVIIDKGRQQGIRPGQAVIDDTAYSFAKITCIPTAGTDQNRQVLVLSQEANLPAVPVETEPAPDKVPKQQKRAKKRE